jgi:hypothetical protein
VRSGLTRVPLLLSGESKSRSLTLFPSFLRDDNRWRVAASRGAGALLTVDVKVSEKVKSRSLAVLGMTIKK